MGCVTWTKRFETPLFAQAFSETDRYILKNLEDAGTPAGHYIVSALLSRRKVISSPNIILVLFTNPSSFIFHPSTWGSLFYATVNTARKYNDASLIFCFEHSKCLFNITKLTNS